MIRFTRIVTVYDQWHFLDWLEDDALFHAETEFILIDDCSPQPMPEPVRARLAARGVRVERPPRNIGYCLGRNLGASLARGVFLDFIDGDDRPLPLRGEDGWDDAALISFPFLVHGRGQSMEQSLTRNPLFRDERAPQGYVDMRVAAVLWRKSAFDALGGFDPRFEGAEDFELALRARTLPRAFATQPKQSYNEQPRARFTELHYSASRLHVCRRRLPESEPLRVQLIAAHLRALHHHSAWALQEAGQRGHLWRACLATLKNLVRATFFRRRA